MLKRESGLRRTGSQIRAAERGRAKQQIYLNAAESVSSPAIQCTEYRGEGKELGMATASENMNPHKAARVAMILWNEGYAAQPGGSMDFWDKLSEKEKKLCREIVTEILASPDEG